MQDIVFSDAQALSTLNSTGVVCSNPYDMELTKSEGATIITNDQVDAFMNVLICAAPATQAAAEGMDVQLREGDNVDMTTGAAILASLHIKLADIAAGKRFSIRVVAPMTMCFLGAWIKATNTGLTTGVTVDIWMSDTPVSENEDIQKIPAAR